MATERPRITNLPTEQKKKQKQKRKKVQNKQNKSLSHNDRSDTVELSEMVSLADFFWAKAKNKTDIWKRLIPEIIKLR